MQILHPLALSQMLEALPGLLYLSIVSFIFKADLQIAVPSWIFFASKINQNCGPKAR